MNWHTEGNNRNGISVEKLFAIIFVLIITILLIVLVLQGSYGDKLNHNLIDFDLVSSDDEISASCMRYNKDVISTNDIYLDFVDDCGLESIDLVDSKYFDDNVFVVHFFQDELEKRPKVFYDYYFSVNAKEVIKIRYYHSFKSSDEVNYIYLVEMKREQIGNSELVIG